MGSGMRMLIRAAYRWLVRQPGYVILTAGDEQLAGEPPQRFARAWLGLMVLSVGWGVASAGLHAAAWSIFGELPGIQLMSVAAVLAGTVLWLYRRAVLALAWTVSGRGPGEAAIGVSVIVVVLTLALLGLKSWKPDWPTNLPWILHWIPRTMFRVLILAPVWGGWAMLIVPQFCRATERTEPAVAAFIRGCGPLTAAVCMAIPLAASLFAFRAFGWWRLSVPAATILATVLGGWLLCRRNGGPTRDALLAANLLTQIVFVLSYLGLIR